MEALKTKIDFAIVISAERCNPNGDPIEGNRPRTDFSGYGEISDVCLKRKIRNRLQDMGHPIFMQSQDRTDDGCHSMKDRVKQCAELSEEIRRKNADIEKCVEIACAKWMDVRSFGQIFPFKGNMVSFNVRGPVSIMHARSLAPVEIRDYQITKSLNIETTENDVKDSSSIGIKYCINKAAYVTYGSIFPQLAEKTGFSEDDAEAIHESLKTLFENDASAARPSGSMNVSRVYWWKHRGKQGMYPSRTVFSSLQFEPSDQYPFYTVTENGLYHLQPEIYTGGL